MQGEEEEGGGGEEDEVGVEVEREWSHVISLKVPPRKQLLAGTRGDTEGTRGVLHVL